MSQTMKVVQCWDDGVTTDARLTDLLRRHNAKATFNLNAGTHKAIDQHEWEYKGTKVQRLTWDVMREVYDGFVIANHGFLHPHLEQIPIDEASEVIVKGRDRLQQFFQQPIRGFAYPFGTYNEHVMNAVREAGHGYARTTKNVKRPFPPDDAMAFHSNCHFLANDLWTQYEQAKEGGVFYFWGHSYEMISDAMWQAFEELIKRISADSESQWVDVIDLFDSDTKNHGRLEAPKSPN